MRISSRLKDVMLKPIFLIRDKRLQKFVLASIIFAIFYLLLVVVIMPSRVSVELGRPSPKTVYAPREDIDEYTTKKLREEAVSNVPEVYDYNPEVLQEALKTVNGFFNLAYDLKEDPEQEIADRADLLGEKLGTGVSQDILITFLLTDASTLQDLQGRLESILPEIMEQGIKLESANTVKNQIMQQINLYPFNIELKRVAEKLVEPLIVPNMFYNPTATAENREAARQGVEPVRIMRGALIVSEGETITEKHLFLLESLGMIRGGHADYPGFVGLFLLLLIIFIAVGLFLFIFDRDVYDNPSLLLLLGLVAIITLLLSIATQFFSGYLIPIATGVILITILFGPRLALMVNLVFALLIGLITSGEHIFVVLSLISGLVAIYSVSRLSQRTDLVKAGFYVSSANAAIIIAMFLLAGNLRLEYGFLREFGSSMLAGIGNGLLSSVIAIGLLPFLESGFGLVTSVTLLELSNPNRSVLRQLLMKAPGTYNHSVVVGNLAEAAAEAIDADPLLVRVGAYYHDIGKITRPYFFTENQFSGDNPHKKLSPNLSALIISTHVKDGLEIARKEKLPVIIQDIIKQHHGTSMISFFYQKALENEHDRNAITEESFRYEGPLPQTKEAAIIMLADAVEAGVRSISRPVGGRIEGVVRKIIKEKLNDGQMDECDLTLKDLDTIGDTFVYILSSIYHTRIEYPEKELKAQIEGGQR